MTRLYFYTRVYFCSIFHHIFKNQIFKSIYSSVTLKSKACFYGNLALRCNSIMKNHSSGMKNKEKDTCIHWRNVFSSSPLFIEDYSTFLHAYKHYMLQTSWDTYPYKFRCITVAFPSSKVFYPSNPTIELPSWFYDLCS